MLPCNVTVEETDTGSTVNIINPKEMLLSNPILSANEEMSMVANDAFERLVRVAQVLESNR